VEEINSNKKYISWPVLTLMAFCTVIGLDDIMYNFQNQGMPVVTSGLSCVYSMLFLIL